MNIVEVPASHVWIPEKCQLREPLLSSEQLVNRWWSGGNIAKPHRALLWLHIPLELVAVWWGPNNGTHWAPRIQHPFSMSPKQTQEKISPKGFRSNLGNMSPLVIYQFAMKAMAHLVRWSKWFPISKLVNNQRESWFIKRNIASIKNAPVFFMVINQWSLIHGFPIFPICFFNGNLPYTSPVAQDRR